MRILTSGEHSKQSRLTHARDTRIVLFQMGELVAALRANDPDACKCWLFGGVQDLGEQVVEALLLDWLDPFLIIQEQDRLLAGLAFGS